MSAKTRGLGRGLDALLPRVERGVQAIDLMSVKPSPYQPRLHMDEVAMAELTASITAKGVLQPILVRPSGAGYEIVAGERRYLAAKQAGLVSIPALVRELSDQETLEIAIIENLQREDLNAVDEARAFKQLLDFGMSQEGVAKAVGKSRSAVANALRLLGLAPEMLEALRDGVLTAGHARAVLAQPEADRTWAFEQIVSHDLSVRQAEALQRPSGPTKRGRSGSDGRYAQLEESLSRHAGTRVRIYGGKRGRIELHYHSEDELTRLIELLGYDA